MFLFFSNSSSIHAYRPENHDAPDLWDALDHRAPIGASLVGGVARYGKQATTVAENIESVAIFCMCLRMFIVFSHVAEDYRCLIDFNFLSVDDHPCFHGFSQNARIEKKNRGSGQFQTCFVLTIPALWIQHVGCFAQERLVSGMLLIQLPWHTLATLKLHISSLKKQCLLFYWYGAMDCCIQE